MSSFDVSHHARVDVFVGGGVPAAVFLSLACRIYPRMLLVLMAVVVVAMSTE